MAVRKQEQVHFSVSPQEKEMLEKIASNMGRTLSSVIKDATIRGIPAVVEDYEKLKRLAGRDEENT